METPANLSFWIDRVAYGITALTLLAATVSASVSSPYAAPAARWARYVGERLLTFFVA